MVGHSVGGYLSGGVDCDFGVCGAEVGQDERWVVFGEVGLSVASDLG